MNLNNIENRYERKFILNSFEKESIIIKLLLSDFHFVPHHEERKVNSIYFDNNYQSLIDNLEGVSDRKKLRIRWYGEENKFKSFFVEKKIKKNFLSSKIRNYVNLNKYINVGNDLELKKIFNKHIKLEHEPIVSIHYKRIYLISSLFPVRATIDFDLFSRKFIGDKLLSQKNLYDKIILEIKYNIMLDEIVRQNLLNLNLRFEKSSKYVTSLTETPSSISI